MKQKDEVLAFLDRCKADGWNHDQIEALKMQREFEINRYSTLLVRVKKKLTGARALGFTRRDLAKRLSIHESELSRIVNDKRRNQRQLDRLDELLDKVLLEPADNL